MRPKAVCFDCAETLMAVRWNPARLATEIANEAGAELGVEAQDAYQTLFEKRWPQFRDVNLGAPMQAYDAFWDKLTCDWLDALGADSALLPSIRAIYRRRLYEDRADVFTVFPDTVPALQALRREGYRLAVISNWDASLDRVLEAHGLTEYFELVVASMVIGSEKPEPEIFEYALRELSLQPHEAAHVGDNPVADLHGARGVGIRGILIDRENPAPSETILRSLSELPEVLA